MRRGRKREPLRFHLDEAHRCCAVVDGNVLDALLADMGRSRRHHGPRRAAALLLQQHGAADDGGDDTIMPMPVPAGSGTGSDVEQGDADAPVLGQKGGSAGGLWNILR